MLNQRVVRLFVQFPISACQFDAPIVLSWPHFLGANESFPAAIEVRF